MFKFIKPFYKDIETVSKWKYDKYFEMIDMSIYKRSNFYGNCNDIIVPSNIFPFIAILDDKLAGFVEYYVTHFNLESAFALNPELLKKNLGTKFIEETLTFGANEINFPGDSLILNVRAKNTRAIHVYEKLLFEKVSYQNGVIMYKKLL
jgi:GNAT superfamily N-acetyltransferase